MVEASCFVANGMTPVHVKDWRQCRGQCSSKSQGRQKQTSPDPKNEVISGIAMSHSMARQAAADRTREAGVAGIMLEAPTRLTGGCACGAVRFGARAEPLRVGLCHCMTCRKAHAAAFNPFIVFKAEAVEVTGKPRSFFSSPGYDRQFCGECGSRVIAFNGDEAEVSLGSLDEPGLLEPQYESWVVRREPWLCALSTPQYSRERLG